MTAGLTKPPATTSETGGEGGPATRRRQLGMRLLALRDASGLSAEEAGLRAGASKATVSRYERGRGNVRWVQVDQLCRVYGTSDTEREELVALAKNSRVIEAWWAPFAGKLPDQMRVLLALEDEVPHIRHLTIGVVPGLLQTLDYAKGIKSTPGNAPSAVDLEEFPTMRVRRQKILDRPNPPTYQVILDESVIRRQVGSPEVMAAQLDYLLTRSKQGNITIQVLPFTAGAYSSALSNHIIFGGSNESGLDVVFLERQSGSVFLEERLAVEEYTNGFDYLLGEALDSNASADLISEARATHLRNQHY
ncbi:helix-turn-helix domain-containing protein [Streptomyces sp. NPDC056549]|uniref:helix-turn-helix domain-containing protein n=1 Tax=Streptomyces sp. NPDC056549 TaxID=3345864 RepID=UPI0036CD80EA